MGKILTLYHGSEKIIKNPVFGEGKNTNDYGSGFYCTENEELAKEWAVNSLRNGFANRYLLDTAYMKVLDLNAPGYSILNWIAVLLQYRTFSVKTPVIKKAKLYLTDNFGINVNAYDVVRGYRADDSYFDYAEAFISNAITVTQLAKAMKLGKLGEQIVLKSEYAFNMLKFDGYSIAEKDKYYILRKSRDDEANRAYLKILEQEDDGMYISEIMKKGIKNGDKSLP